MVGKIFLYGISFTIVYNESDHKHMTNFEYLFFTEFRKKYQSFYNSDGGACNSTVSSHTHISIK